MWSIIKLKNLTRKAWSLEHILSCIKKCKCCLCSLSIKCRLIRYRTVLISWHSCDLHSFLEWFTFRLHKPKELEEIWTHLFFCFFFWGCFCGGGGRQSVMLAQSLTQVFIWSCTCSPCSFVLHWWCCNRILQQPITLQRSSDAATPGDYKAPVPVGKTTLKHWTVSEDTSAIHRCCHVGIPRHMPCFLRGYAPRSLWWGIRCQDVVCLFSKLRTDCWEEDYVSPVWFRFLQRTTLSSCSFHGYFNEPCATWTVVNTLVLFLGCESILFKLFAHIYVFARVLWVKLTYAPLPSPQSIPLISDSDLKDHLHTVVSNHFVHVYFSYSGLLIFQWLHCGSLLDLKWSRPELILITCSGIIRGVFSSALIQI